MSVSFPATLRRLSAATAVAASCIATTALPAAAADHHQNQHRDQVVISEVHADSSGRGSRYDRSLNREWVEITNNGRRDVNLSGWTLSDSDGNTYTFRHFRLDDRATVRIHTGYGRNTGSDLYQNRRSPIWDNNDTATLRDNRGRFIDTTSWGNDRRHDNDRYDNGRYDNGRYDNRHDDNGRHHR
ncbi:lamin tail domain-containing protein [Streptomyces sp. NPDC001984]